MWPTLGIYAVNLSPIVIFLLVLAGIFWVATKGKSAAVGTKFLPLRSLQIATALFVADVILAATYFVTSGAVPQNILINFLPILIFILVVGAIVLVVRKAGSK